MPPPDERHTLKIHGQRMPCLSGSSISGRKKRSDDRPVDRSLGDVARLQHQIFALSYRLSRSRLSDEQIGSFAFQKRRNYSIDRRMDLVRDRLAASEQAVTTPLYWAWTGAFGPNSEWSPFIPNKQYLVCRP